MSNDKAQKSKPDSRSRGKKNRSDNNQPKVNCIIQFKDPKPSDESIKAKFTESDGAEVSEVIRGYKTSDNQANLMLLMNRMVNLGDLYDMFENGKSKKLAQTMSRALDGQVRDDWIEIVNDVDDWENDNEKREFIRLLKKLGSEAFGPKAFKNQCKAMESGMLKIPENNLRVGTYRLIQINKMLPYLGLQAKSYDIGDLNKIIVKSLSPKAMGKYVGEEGDELDDVSDILSLMSVIETKLQLKKEVKALEEEKQRKQKSNQQSNDKGKKGGDAKGEQKKNPCRKHDGAHDFRDCPDNPHRKGSSSKPASESNKEKSIKKDLHSTKGSESNSKKTPSVAINESKNSYADLDYSSDDGSAMMVLASKNDNKQLIGTTVIEVPSQDEKRHATTVLIDNGFTCYAIMSHPFAEKLGYEYIALD